MLRYFPLLFPTMFGIVILRLLPLFVLSLPSSAICCCSPASSLLSTHPTIHPLAILTVNFTFHHFFFSFTVLRYSPRQDQDKNQTAATSPTPSGSSFSRAPLRVVLHGEKFTLCSDHCIPGTECAYVVKSKYLYLLVLSREPAQAYLI